MISGDSPRWALRLLLPLVGSERLTNGKRKGRGNTKNGNKYLAWAYIEAANFAVRYNAAINRYYQRKGARATAWCHQGRRPQAGPGLLLHAARRQ